MKVFVPKGYLPEKTYAFHVLLKEIMNLDFELSEYDGEVYEIHADNGKYIKIQDAFWKKFPDGTYLRKEAMPVNPVLLHHELTPESDLVSLYGDTEFALNEDYAYCGSDIIASSFFLLSRWEEYISEDKDKFNRFPGEASWLQQQNLHYRPLVDEYAVFLKNILFELGVFVQEPEQRFSIKPTHDVDNLLRFPSLKATFKTIGGDLFVRKDVKAMFRTIVQAFRIKIGKQTDPYDTFSWLMDLSEKYQLKSAFYFIPSNAGERDHRYSMNHPFVLSKLHEIKKRGQIAGLHASLNSFRNQEQMNVEVERMKDAGAMPAEGRQHYLLFEVPGTWQSWYDAGMQYDLSLAYENDGGFRCGICREYSVFNVETRTMLGLKEKPTIVMERALMRAHPNPEVFEEKFMQLRDVVKKYNGEFVFLWHQDNLNRYEMMKYKQSYEKVLMDAKSNA